MSTFDSEIARIMACKILFAGTGGLASFVVVVVSVIMTVLLQDV